MPSPKKTPEEQEIDAIVRAQAENTVMLQKLATSGAEMEKWVLDGHYDFIQKRILNPVEAECFKKVKEVRLGAAAIANIAKVKGTLEVFDIINARINSVIVAGKNAVSELNNLKNSTL